MNVIFTSTTPYNVSFDGASVYEVTFAGFIGAPGGGDSLPDQTGNAGKVLGTDGTDASWVTVSGSGIVDPTVIEDSDNAVSGGAVFDELALKEDKVSGKGLSTEDYSTAEKAKLLSIATGATVNSSDATLLARANHTGTQSADTLTDGTTNKAYTATEKTKLAGIADGATANSSDATLLARANHTGTQAATTITEDSTHRFATDSEKTTWNAKQALLVSGTNIKTINGSTLLGSGDITITGGEGGGTIDSDPTEGSTNAVQSGGTYDAIQSARNDAFLYALMF